ncbi:hypothetical protein [Enterococcus sp. AZ191]|uniref:hypothetical protein n=1 Tax=Enterococcus sp. AZ191 TaxID=2774639 RepID=UPI003F682338
MLDYWVHKDINGFLLSKQLRISRMKKNIYFEEVLNEKITLLFVFFAYSLDAIQLSGGHKVDGSRM